MKKTVRTVIIATLLTIAIIISCACATAANAELGKGEFYPRLTVVIACEPIPNSNVRIIYCQDKEGNVWSFYDDKGEWQVGDISNLLMENYNGKVEDDEILETYWEGYTEDVNAFLEMDGWR